MILDEERVVTLEEDKGRLDSLSNLTRRNDFNLFIVTIMKNGELIHQTQAIVCYGSPSAGNFDRILCQPIEILYYPGFN